MKLKLKMKSKPAMKYNYYIILVLLLPVSLSLCGQQMSDSKTFSKTFDVGDNAALEVTNKYGDIHISHTLRDHISVRAEVTATSNKGDRLDAMMSDVEISLTKTDATVRAVTSFSKGITPLFESLKGLTKNLINFDSRLKIDYFIECPAYTSLRISNSYGDVYIGDETSELELKLSNGNLDAGTVRKVLLMELTFCKANVKSISEGKLMLSFSELRTREAEKVKLESISSKVWIDRCNTLDLDSKRDDLNFESVNVITGTSYFSDIIACNVSDEINMVVKYGNLSFENIMPEFSVIDLRSSYTDIDLVMAERASYNLEIRHTNAFVSLPGIKPEPERTEVSADDRIYLTRASVGSTPDRSEIRIDATRGEVRILQK
jgi:hypothetical protein